MQGVDVLKKIENAGDEDGRPSVTVKIIYCGELSESENQSSGMVDEVSHVAQSYIVALQLLLSVTRLFLYCGSCYLFLIAHTDKKLASKKMGKDLSSEVHSHEVRKKGKHKKSTKERRKKRKQYSSSESDSSSDTESDSSDSDSDSDSDLSESSSSALSSSSEDRRKRKKRSSRRDRYRRKRRDRRREKKRRKRDKKSKRRSKRLV